MNFNFYFALIKDVKLVYILTILMGLIIMNIKYIFGNFILYVGAYLVFILWVGSILDKIKGSVYESD